MAAPPKSSVRFDPDLSARLDRVYGGAGSSGLDRARMAMPSARRSQGSKALQEALAELRSHRERAQSSMKMQEEIDYLREQVELLRSLSDELDRLRRALARRQ